MRVEGKQEGGKRGRDGYKNGWLRGRKMEGQKNIKGRWKMERVKMRMRRRRMKKREKRKEEMRER